MKYRICIMHICILIISVISLSGCSRDEKMTEAVKYVKGFEVYYLSDNNDELFSERYELTTNDMNDIINEIIVYLRKGSYENADQPVIPQHITACTFNLNDNILIINFDENYYQSTGLEEVLRRAAIVKTFCQLSFVKYVKITVDSQVLEIDGNIIGNMNESTFIDNIGSDGDVISTKKVNIYFTNSDGDKLVNLEMYIDYDGVKSIEELTIMKLIEGPSRIGYYPTLNSDIVINSLIVNDNKCYIDFNDAFLKKTKGVKEEVEVYSIVNTLVELTGINKVLFTVNGHKIEEYWGDVYMGDFIERNYEVNENIN